MELLIIYAIFAIIVAIASTFIIVGSVMYRLLYSGIENNVTENRWLCYIVAFISSVLVAPFWFYVLISEERTTTAIGALYEALSQD